MTLFILTETSAGYALLKAKDKKLLKRDDLATEAATAEGISNLYVQSLPRFFFSSPCGVADRRKNFVSKVHGN
jgi:hypothetical protein